MARQARIVMPGRAHHVMQGGNYRMQIFESDEDREVYLEYLRESAEKHALTVNAYCLMDTHVHLVATPKKHDSLAKTLSLAHLLYAQRYNRERGMQGHLWQSRFFSCALDDHYTDKAILYVELNPVRAKLTRSATRYAWSSAAAHCGATGDSSGLLNLDAWFAECDADYWKDALKDGLKPEDIAKIRLHTTTGRPLGDDDFINAIEKKLKRSVRPRPPGRPKGKQDSKPRVRSKRVKSASKPSR